MLLPKEHGAYAQAIFPLVAGLAVTGLRWSSVLLTVAIGAGFVSHEPLLVALGRRGRREREEQGSAARRWLAGLTSVLVIAGCLALVRMPGRTPWLVLLPIVPAAVVLVCAWRGTEKQWVAQVGVALAFSLTVVPICAAAGVPVAAYSAIAAVYAVNFILGSLAVRVVVLRVRGGGNPGAVDLARRTVLGVAIAAATAGAVFLAVGGTAPLSAVLAFLTGIALPVLLASFPPAPSQLRRVGWTLVGASATVTMLLIAGYRGP
jgi:hypothetical protein